MRICDLPEEDIHVGMRIRSLRRPTLLGTITRIDIEDDYCWIQWDDQFQAFGGFYENDCECEIVDGT